MSERLRTCALHPKAPAGWSCEVCLNDRCPDCVSSQKAGHGEVVVCTTCGTITQPIRKHRSAKPYVRWIGGAWHYPLDKHVWLVWVSTGVFTGLCGFLCGGGLVATAIQWAVLFHALHESSLGHEGLDAPEFTDFFGDLISPMFRALVVITISILPAALYVGLSKFGAGRWDSNDPLLWPFLLFILFYLPLGLIFSALKMPVYQLLNPLGLFACARRLGNDYVIAVACTIAAGVCDWLLGKLDMVLEASGIPVLPSIINETLLLYPLLVLMRCLGLLLYVRGDDIDYGHAEGYWEPVLREQPRGSWSPPVIEERQKIREPIELEEPADAVRRRFEAGKYDEALNHYVDGGIRPGDVPPEQLLRLGQRAAGQGNYPLALSILDSIVLANGAHPIAGQAMVISARIHGERLGNTAQAQALYRRVVERFPGSEAADFASKQLAPAT
jgi:hypothetical protein